MDPINEAKIQAPCEYLNIHNLEIDSSQRIKVVIILIFMYLHLGFLGWDIVTKINAYNY